MRKINLSVLLCLSLALLGSYCGGGTSSNADKDTGNQATAYDTSLLTITSVTVDSGTVFKAGRSNNLTVGVTSKCDSDATDIPISFYIMPDDKNVSDTSGEETVYAGTYVIPVVKIGEGTYPLVINVPELSTGYGSYKVIACFYDQVMQSPTTDDNGNLSDEAVEPVVNDDAIIGELDVPVDPTTSALPDIFIEKATISTPGLTLFTNKVNPTDGNPDLSVTIETQVLAKDVSNATISFSLQSLNGQLDLPLKIKNSNGSLSDSVSVGAMTKYNEMVLNYSLDFTDNLSTLVNYVKAGSSSRYEFVIVSTIKSSEETDDGCDFENNTVNSSFWIIPDDSVLLAKNNAKDFGFDWSRKYGNSYISGGLEVSSHTGMTTDLFYTNNKAAVPFAILKFKFKALDAYVKGTLHYTSNTSDGVSAKLTILGDDLFSFNGNSIEWSSQGVGALKPIVDQLIAVDKEAEVVNVDYFDGSEHPGYYIEKNYEGSYFVMVGPIPVTFGWQVGGYAGFAGFAYLGPAAAAGFIPYAGLSAGAFGGIGCPIARVTINMKVNLIELQLQNVAWLTYEFKKDTNNLESISFIMNEYSGLDLTFLSGELYLEAKFPGIKWKKKKWGRYPVPCIITKTKTIYQFAGINSDIPFLPRKQYEFLIPLY